MPEVSPSSVRSSWLPEGAGPVACFRLGPVGARGRTAKHHFETPADNALVMRRLLWTLASMDCLTATWLTAAGQGEAACPLVSRAGELLETRARSRDDGEPWKPIVGREWTRPE